uniref:StAR-related lipid transfer (START) domain containing 15 n=1 Tax=Echeneis naucrates TaxID=173247 RepID=A0A665UKI3_ECHNA
KPELCAEMPVQIPDDSDFSSFKDQCLSPDGWTSRYSKGGVTVWTRDQENQTVQKLKMRIVCKDVAAETLYDVLHDTSYRRKWDTNMIETYDIGRLTVNADVGYYSWKCPSPLKNRDFVTMRSWLPLGNDFLIINSSDLSRHVSSDVLQTSQGPHSNVLSLSTGSLPKWVVNRVSQFVGPKAMRKIYKASLKYPDWKRKHDPWVKPWMFPEQNMLQNISASDLTLQRVESLENIDESGVSEEKRHSDDDDT